MLALTAILALSLLPQAAAADVTLPPAAAHATITTTGRGTQVYKCDQQNNTFLWAFQEATADLFDTHTNLPVGTLTAGPIWTWNDNSVVTGKILHSSPSPNPDAIPWLLLAVHSTGGSGTLAHIQFVRRSNTQAGAAPSSGCDAQHIGNVLHVPYLATYTFYTAQ